jgi:cysteine desulfurase
LECVVEELGGKVLGKGAPRLPNTVCALFSTPGDLLVMALDLKGVHASTGSACSSGASKASHVLSAMGEEGIPVRFSFDSTTDIDALCVILREVISSMEQL